jgi:hypothetical protein
MKGNLHVRFLEEWEGAIPPSYSAIGRIFADTHYPWVSALSAQSVFYPMDNKPQRAQRTQRKVETLCALCVLCGRFILSTAMDFGKTTQRKGRKERKAMRQDSPSCLKKFRYDINNEPRRTETNSGYSEFVRVRISSVLSLLFAPAHERAQPAPAFHQRLSRAGG